MLKRKKKTDNNKPVPEVRIGSVVAAIGANKTKGGMMHNAISLSTVKNGPVHAHIFAVQGQPQAPTLGFYLWRWSRNKGQWSRLGSFRLSYLSHLFTTLELLELWATEHREELNQEVPNGNPWQLELQETDFSQAIKVITQGPICIGIWESPFSKDESHWFTIRKVVSETTSTNWFSFEDIANIKNALSLTTAWLRA